MSGCENCRKTERNLAQAYMQIERLLDVSRNVAVAEDAREAALRLAKDARIDVAVWLEEQR